MLERHTRLSLNPCKFHPDPTVDSIHESRLRSLCGNESQVLYDAGLPRNGPQGLRVDQLFGLFSSGIISKDFFEGTFLGCFEGDSKTNPATCGYVPYLRHSHI